MTTTSDYYKYAALATASYVRMGNEPLTGARFSEVANDQGRMPLTLGQYLFTSTSAIRNVKMGS